MSLNDGCKEIAGYYGKGHVCVNVSDACTKLSSLVLDEAEKSKYSREKVLRHVADVMVQIEQLLGLYQIANFEIKNREVVVIHRELKKIRKELKKIEKKGEAA